MEKLELATKVNADILQVWEFFRIHDNIQYLSPPESEIQIIYPVSPVILSKDEIIHYKVKNPMGTYTTWKAIITDFEKPHFIADEQIEGLFSFWRQEYSFRQIPHEGTEIINTIYYEPPWGKLGKVINVVFAQSALIDLLEYRSSRLKELLNLHVAVERLY